MIVKTMDKRVYYGNKLSDNIIIDSNGQMIAANVPIARTGTQEYMGFELSEELDSNQVYLIERLPEDVFNKGFMASFENKPFTNTHPDEDVIVGKNHDQLAKGFITNVRPGHLEVRGLDKKYYDKNGNNVLYADIVITDSEMIEFIKEELEKPYADRKIDVSCGYDAEYIQTGDTTFKQVGKIGNHLALVPKGRAGVAKIRDNSAIEIKHSNEYFKKALPYEFEGGLKKLGISKYQLLSMSADEYFDELVYKARTHFKAEVRPSDQVRVDDIINYINDGGLLDIPYILYNSSGEGSTNQDGRHRVEAMKRLGVGNIPVLIFYKTHERMKTDDRLSVKIGDSIFESDTIEDLDELREIASILYASTSDSRLGELQSQLQRAKKELAYSKDWIKGTKRDLEFAERALKREDSKDNREEVETLKEELKDMKATIEHESKTVKQIQDLITKEKTKSSNDGVTVTSTHENLVRKIIDMGKDKGLSDREAKSVVTKYEEIVGKNFTKMDIGTIRELISDIT